MRPRSKSGAVIIGESATVAFDCTVRESHDQRWDVTRHEAESSAAVAENVRKKPRELELIIITTDTPLRELNDTSKNRDRYVLRTLEAIANNVEIVNIKCHLGLLQGYIIESITTPVTAQDGESLSPQIKLVEYRQISTTSIATPDAYLDALVSDTASQPDAAPSGAVSGGVGAESADAEASGSLLSRIDDSLDGGLTNTLSGVGETLGGLFQ